MNCTAPGCGWDAYTHSAKRFDCPVCHGIGKVTTWQIFSLRARVNWPAMIQFSYFNPSPGVDLGDVVLTVGQADKASIERIQSLERVYLVVDGKIVRPSTVQKLDVPQIGEEYQVVCHLFTPSE